MTETGGPNNDAYGRPMIKFEGMPVTNQSQAVDMPDAGRPMLDFPSLKKDASETQPVGGKLLMQTPEPEAGPVELSEYVPMEVSDYSALDVSEENLDLTGVDGQTRQHIESIRYHDFESVVESLMPELEGISEEDMQKYITGPLEAAKNAADVTPYITYAIQHLLRIHDFRKQAQGG